MLSADYLGAVDIISFKKDICNTVRDALSTLEDIELQWEMQPDSAELRGKYYLLRYYLDYIRRYCEL